MSDIQLRINYFICTFCVLQPSMSELTSPPHTSCPMFFLCHLTYKILFTYIICLLITNVKLTSVIGFSDTEYLYELDYSGEMLRYNVENETVTTVVNKSILVSVNVYFSIMSILPLTKALTTVLRISIEVRNITQTKHCTRRKREDTSAQWNINSFLLFAAK